MNQFESYLRDRHAEAIDARGAAEGELVARIDEGEALADKLRAVAEARAFAEWWEQLIIHIDQGGDDPYDGLLVLRETARQVLLERPAPRNACPFTLGFAIASIEGARRFYRETAPLDVTSAQAKAAK